MMILTPTLRTLGLITALISSNLNAEEYEIPSSKPPLELSQLTKSCIKKVQESVVSVAVSGTGSGVIISPEGHIITAAHMFRGIDDAPKLKIILADGSKAEAKLLGLNHESDYALLQITTPSDKPWPHCELADTAKLTGEFCIAIGHPSGYLKGRPAQARLGRITSHSTKNDKPYYLFADCNIQPGDSGGPLFSLEGKLIGMDSSAGGILGLNIFPAIDQFHVDRDRLLNSERWGDIDAAPDGPHISKVSFNQNSLALIQKEFMRRMKIEYPPTVDFVQALANDKGEVRLDQHAMAKHMIKPAIAYSKGNPVSIGMDDPAVVKMLPPLPAKTPRSLPIYAGDSLLGQALAVDGQYFLTKASLLPEDKNATLKVGGKTFELSHISSDPNWDLALLKSANSFKVPAIDWASTRTDIVAGDLLMARDHRGRVLWNVATDAPRVVSKKRSIGPLDDKSIISKHRAPYPIAIRHALPLYAQQAGTPVFDADGKLVGMHIARFSRTFGLIIPTNELEKVYNKLLAQENP